MSRAMFFRDRRKHIKLHYIQPGKPTQNAFMDSFKGQFRSYCLKLHKFASLEVTRETTEQWRTNYNHVRLYCSVGGKSSAAFASAAA